MTTQLLADALRKLISAGKSLRNTVVETRGCAGMDNHDVAIREASAALTVHDADARFWLAGDRGPFDAIVVDAYTQPYIPFHLATTEFFTLVRDRLTPNGVVAINVGTPPDGDEVVDRIASTMRAVFPAVLTARYGQFNSIVLGFNNAAAAADFTALADKLK